RLLAFSRRAPVEATLVRPQELMPELLELMRRTLGERIEVRLRADDGVWPIRVDKAQFEAALLNMAVNARDAMPDGGSLTIVVEDDPDVRQVAVATLRTLGFEVREAETGDEAAAMLRRGDAVSLLLSDITMPGSMTGVDLAHFVRRERPEIDVLLTSGYADSE